MKYYMLCTLAFFSFSAYCEDKIYETKLGDDIQHLIQQYKIKDAHQSYCHQTMSEGCFSASAYDVNINGTEYGMVFHANNKGEIIQIIVNYPGWKSLFGDKRKVTRTQAFSAYKNLLRVFSEKLKQGKDKTQEKNQEYTSMCAISIKKLMAGEQLGFLDTFVVFQEYPEYVRSEHENNVTSIGYSVSNSRLCDDVPNHAKEYAYKHIDPTWSVQLMESSY